MMKVQKRLAAKVLKCGIHRVWLDPNSLDEIKEAITKTDIRQLIGQGIIAREDGNFGSKFWARKRKTQKSKGKQKGFGSRKGKATAREPAKRAWMNKIRLQRKFIKNLRDDKKIEIKDYHDLYMKSKGGFFRSLRHLKLYTQEHNLVKK